MRKPADETRQQILEAAYKLFYRKGFGRVGMNEIAEQAGLTKRTLYHHFESKDQLLGDMLAYQHELAMARIQDDARTYTGNAGDLLSSRFDALASWTRQQGWTGSGFTRLALELADLPGHPGRRMARRHKAAVEDDLRRRLAESGTASADERAREASILFEGTMVMILLTGDQSYVDVARRLALRMTRPEAAAPQP